MAVRPREEHFALQTGQNPVQFYCEWECSDGDSPRSLRSKSLKVKQFFHEHSAARRMLAVLCDAQAGCAGDVKGKSPRDRLTLLVTSSP